ncbi:phosphatase PAP2 family protein [Bacillus sp. CHD6a]|uniref:phosphatase PAP2 family protein n=1 Tax=Bacillus sp. CHD6a TaxID=1643452 RepID=UPI0007620893|nr:phosphatase PAP2 family protein [Bacillus sp. CHD6a]
METELGNKHVQENHIGKWRRLILFLLCGAFFIWAFQQIMNEQTIGFDESIRNFVIGLEADVLISFFHLFTMLGDKTGVIIIMVLSILMIWWKKRDYKAMAIIVGGVILVNELNKWLKDFTGRERPMTGPGAESLSFPSGHAMVGLFFYGLLVYFAQSGIRLLIAIFGTVFIALLGTSRLFLNYHYPSDVFAGYAAGYVCLIFGVLLYEWSQSFRKNKRAM